MSLLTLILLSLTNAQANPDLLSFQKTPLGFQLDTQYLFTTHNYNNNGQIESLVEDHSFHLIEEKIKILKNWNKDHYIFGEINLANSISDDPDFKRSNFGVQSLNIGYNYNLGEWTLDPYLNFELEVPLNKFDYNSDEAMIGDGALGARAGLHFIKKFRKFTTHNYLGYKYRSEGLSSLLEWKISGYWTLKAFILGLGAQGFDSLSKDFETDNAARRKNLIDNLNSGSFRFASVNPAATDINVFFGYKWTRSFATNIDIATSISGIRYSQGTTYAINLLYTPNFAESDETSDGSKFEYETEDDDNDQDSGFEELEKKLTK